MKTLSANILSAVGQITYNEPVLLPSEFKEYKVNRSIKTGKFIDHQHLKLFPNPARKYVIVEYNLKEKCVSGNEASLILTRMDGYLIFSKKVAKRQDQEFNQIGWIFAGHLLLFIVDQWKTSGNKKVCHN